MIEQFLGLLQDVRPAGPGKWECKCPAHDDRSASLSVTVGEEQPIVCFCHAGCDPADVFQSVGLSWKDVCSKEQAPTPIPNRIVATYDYRDANGRLLFQVMRYAPKKTFKQRMPDPERPDQWLYKVGQAQKVPFRLPELLASLDPVYICEGEKDVLSMVAAGYTATCNAGGAGKWSDAWGQFFQGRQVFILPDNDEPGRKHAQDVLAKLKPFAESVEMLTVPEPHKDVTDYLHAGGSVPALHAPTPAPPIDPAAVRDAYNRARDTHLGNAERLVRVADGKLRFCDGLGGWHSWTGTHWQRSDLGARKVVIEKVIPEIYTETAQAALAHDGELVKRLSSWAKRSESLGVIQGTIDCAEALLSTSAEEWDRYPWLLNCRNGTISLKTGQLLPHNPDDLITREVPVDFDPTATCPTWERFLDEAFIGRRGLIEWIQRAVGYSLTGSVQEQCAFLLYGGGANGKSTFNNTVAWIMGQYARETNADTLMATDRQSGINNDVARLRGARLVSCNETEQGQRLAESKFKGLTGGDRLTARFLHREFIEFEPTFKIWIRSNHLPQVTGTDQGIWRRIRLIPFEANFEGRKDPAMGAKLIAEAAGILAWAVRGALEWQKKGLEPPAEVIAATQEYREGQDTIGQFLADHVTVIKNYQVATVRLYERYQKWCEANGNRCVSNKRLISELKDRGWKCQKMAPDWGRYWIDVAFTDQHPDLESETF